ncbi:hypothetical protein BV20DRAFT_42196 [Pilatotrama ljubarskyi]|nr:hypothetical protein BV20DRAFT_42196 [Pilatotrama ljubarskyi]
MSGGGAGRLSADLLNRSAHLTSPSGTSSQRGTSPCPILLSLAVNLSASCAGSDPAPLPTPIAVFILHPRLLNARPIMRLTTPKGADKVRVCLHALNKRMVAESFVSAMVEWAVGDRRATGGHGRAAGGHGRAAGGQRTRCREGPWIGRDIVIIAPCDPDLYCTTWTEKWRILSNGQLVGFGLSTKFNESALLRIRYTAI